MLKLRQPSPSPLPSPSPPPVTKFLWFHQRGTSNAPFVEHRKNPRKLLKITFHINMVSKITGVTEPNLRCSPNKYKLGHPKDRPGPDPDPDPNSNSDSPYPFDVLVTDSNCLPIPYEVAGDFFPISSSNSSCSEQTIQLPDPLNHHWPSIGDVFFDSEKAFILTHNWVQFACLFNLQFMDIVMFLRPNPRFGNNHFTTQHFHRPGFEPIQMRLPALLPHNRLFEGEFGQRELQLGVGRLVIQAELENFYILGIIKEFKQEMVMLTDYKDEDWFVKMVYSRIGDLYILMDDRWEGYVGEHKLEVTDRVLFFKPNIHYHDKHFLIQVVKREKGDRLTEPEQRDCVSADDKKLTNEEQFTSQISSVLPGISAETLAAIQNISGCDGIKSINDFMKQQKAYQFNRQPSLSLQISATSLPLHECPSKRTKPANLNPDPKSEPLHDPSEPDSYPHSSYLVIIYLTDSDCLPICYKVAFNSIPSSSDYEDQTVKLTKTLNCLWQDCQVIRYVCFNAEEDFIVTNKGPRYTDTWNLKLMDSICFLKSDQNLEFNHLMTQLFPHPESEPVGDDNNMIMDEWMRVLRKLELGACDWVRYCKPDVRAYYKHFYIQFVNKEEENKQPEFRQSGYGSEDKGKGIAGYF